MDSYANRAEMSCGALIYTRVARDWCEWYFYWDKTRSLCSCFEVTLLFSDNMMKNILAERKYLIDCVICDIS